jgi:tetratricopeptide (TPR) repeat protein
METKQRLRPGAPGGGAGRPAAVGGKKQSTRFPGGLVSGKLGPGPNAVPVSESGWATDMDHDLLFGAVAVQAEVIDPDQFTAALADWSAKKESPLARVLLERGWINEADRQHLDYLVAVRLRKHAGNPAASLAALADDRVIRTLRALPPDGFPSPPRSVETRAQPSTVPPPPVPSRWAQRNKKIVTGLGALLLTAVAALALGTMFINRQKARAEANFQLALDAVDRFFVRVSEDRLLNEPATQPLRKELLQTVRDFDERFVAENVTDPARRADLAKVLTMLAKVTAEIGDPAKAATEYERALGLYGYLEEAEPRNLAYRRGRATCKLGLGIATRSTNPARAEQEYKEALGLFEALSREASDDLALRSKLALCHNDLSQLYLGLDRQTEAVAQQDLALALQQQLVDREPDNPEYLRDLAGSLGNRATSYVKAKHLDAAVAAQRQALELRRRLAERPPLGFAAQEDLGQSLNNLALTLEQAERYEESLRLFQECLRVRERLVASTPGVPRLREQYAWTYNNLAYLYKYLKRPAERDKAMQRAIELMEALHADFKEEGTYAVSLAGIYLITGYHAHYDDGRHETALEWFDKVIRLLAPQGPEKVHDAAARPVVRDAYWTRALALNALKRPGDALLDWERALAVDDGTNRTELRLEHSRTLLRLRDHGRAVAEAEELAGDRSVTGATDFDLAVIFCISALVVQADAALPEPERERKIAALRERALQLLVRARQVGYFKDVAHRERFEKEKYLDPIREQFKKASGWTD